MNAGLILIFVINSIECVKRPLGYVGATGKKSFFIDKKTKQVLKKIMLLLSRMLLLLSL